MATFLTCQSRRSARDFFRAGARPQETIRTTLCVAPYRTSIRENKAGRIIEQNKPLGRPGEKDAGARSRSGGPFYDLRDHRGRNYVALYRLTVVHRKWTEVLGNVPRVTRILRTEENTTEARSSYYPTGSHRRLRDRLRSERYNAGEKTVVPRIARGRSEAIAITCRVIARESAKENSIEIDLNLAGGKPLVRYSAARKSRGSVD